MSRGSIKLTSQGGPMKIRRLLILAVAVAANVGFAAVNLRAEEAGTWRYCNCKSPPYNCCTVEADQCNGCIANPQ
jgi:hypothetical protein